MIIIIIISITWLLFGINIFKPSKSVPLIYLFINKIKVCFLNGVVNLNRYDKPYIDLILTTRGLKKEKCI